MVGFLSLLDDGRRTTDDGMLSGGKAFSVVGGRSSVVCCYVSRVCPRL
jgi:hypothetical protein